MPPAAPSNAVAADALAAEADRAAARGDAAAARALLQQAIDAGAPSVDLWLKLAAMCRAGGDEAAAARAVGGALTVDPLHPLALLLRAHLLERAGDPAAGEAYGRALAQHDGSAPTTPQLDAMLRRAAERYAAYVAQRDARLRDAMAAAAAAASPDQAARLARLRSNSLRVTRPYHSEPTHYHFPGLVEREFHDRADFPWLAQLEAATDAIRADFERVAGAERAELVPYIQYPADAPVRQWQPLNHNRDWTAIHLLQNGRRIEANARHCAATMAALAALPQPVIPGCSPNAMFSLLAPGTRIPPHTGVANTRLVCHLPLVVPPRCWFRVGATTREWQPGEAFVFDDTIEHEAANDSDELRVVFIVDVWHPGLAPAERDGVAALMASDGAVPGGL